MSAYATAANPRLAVIGCGNWGRNLVRVLSTQQTLAAVCDADTKRAGAIAEEFGVVASSVGRILSDDSIDGVLIAAPAEHHHSLARDALLAGKHTFVEKPLSLRLGDAEELCALAAERKRVLMVGHLLRYHPAFQRLEVLIDEGALGKLQYAYSNRLNLGRFRTEENILWSFAPHDLSMILAIFGASPTEVRAEGHCYLHTHIADVTTTHLSFEGGLAAHIFVSWLHPFKEQRLVVIGDRGMIVFDDGKAWDQKLLLYRHNVNWENGIPTANKAEGIPVSVKPAEPLDVECRHFVNCIRTGATPITDGREGVRVLSVLRAAELSMRK